MTVIMVILCYYVVSKLSLVIGETWLDIVNLNKQAHIVLLDLIKKLVSQTVIIMIIKVDM